MNIIIELQCGCKKSFIDYLREHKHFQEQIIMMWCENCVEGFRPVDYKMEDLDNEY